jgi:hypothetical protein
MSLESAWRIRCRVDFEMPSKMATSSAPASGSDIRWRDGWISSIGWKPAARSVCEYAGDAGTSASAATTSTPSSARSPATSTSRFPSPVASPLGTGPRGTYALNPPICGHGRSSARTPGPPGTTTYRGSQPLAARWAAQARDW